MDFPPLWIFWQVQDWEHKAGPQMRPFYHRNPVRERILWPRCCTEHPLEVFMRENPVRVDPWNEGDFRGKKSWILALCLEFYPCWDPRCWQGKFPGCEGLSPSQCSCSGCCSSHSSAGAFPASQGFGSLLWDSPSPASLLAGSEFVCKEISFESSHQLCSLLILPGFPWEVKRIRPAGGILSEEKLKILSEEKLAVIALFSLHPKNRGRLQWGKSAFLDPKLLQLGNSKDKANRWFHCPYPQQLWHSTTPSCLFHDHPWWPFQLSIPKVSLLGWAFHSFSLVPDPGFISFIWSWFFPWEERGNNCLGATHDSVDLYHNCIISASSWGFMGTLDVIFGAFVSVFPFPLSQSPHPCAFCSGIFSTGIHKKFIFV